MGILRNRKGRSRARGLWWAIGTAALVVIVVSGVTLTSGSARPATTGLDSNPYLDPGTHLSGLAPDFTLTDQFDRPVSLRSFRGRVVILAFNDSDHPSCTSGNCSGQGLATINGSRRRDADRSVDLLPAIGAEAIDA